MSLDQPGVEPLRSSFREFDYILAKSGRTVSTFTPRTTREERKSIIPQKQSEQQRIVTPIL